MERQDFRSDGVHNVVTVRVASHVWSGIPVHEIRMKARQGRAWRYVLEGSVRRSGNVVRVNAQLIDATTDAHLWAGRYVRDTGELFALQRRHHPAHRGSARRRVDYCG